MTPELVQHVLVQSFSASQDGGSYHIDADRKCVVLISHDSGLMQVSDVIAVHFHDDLISIETDDDQTYYFANHTIFGLKGRSANKAPQRPGFRPTS